MPVADAILQPYIDARTLPEAEEVLDRLAAAEINRTDRAIPWPPGRNDPCWCRSGRKYKRCCGRA